MSCLVVFSFFISLSLPPFLIVVPVTFISFHFISKELLLFRHFRSMFRVLLRQATCVTHTYTHPAYGRILFIATLLYQQHHKCSCCLLRLYTRLSAFGHIQLQSKHILSKSLQLAHHKHSLPILLNLWKINWKFNMTAIQWANATKLAYNLIWLNLTIRRDSFCTSISSNITNLIYSCHTHFWEWLRRCQIYRIVFHTFKLWFTMEIIWWNANTLFKLSIN